uniref:Cation-transporting P-type ATPase N-terminal domain-containing protein n=1 Tax=Ananas comosus var. bracteatus TaxID=296719 RepID=A0A6V7P577_ANACO|nr:unnamed protein product [Ananas comosus var. bracteatus]
MGPRRPGWECGVKVPFENSIIARIGDGAEQHDHARRDQERGRRFGECSDRGSVRAAEMLREGLTSAEGENRLNIFGPNKLEEKKENKFLKFLGFMWNPLSWVMEMAAIMAIALANGGGQPPDWEDFENNAGNAAAALMANLAPKTKVLRDGRWTEQEAAILVPGDIISIKLGDIVPADARLLEGDPLKVDQSALTGESLPVTKNPGDEVFSGSTCKQGEIEAVVIATGVHTFFGKAAHLVDSTNQVGHFQKVLTAIGNFCICSIALGIVVEIIVMFPIQRRPYRRGIDNLLVLLIGGSPSRCRRCCRSRWPSGRTSCRSRGRSRSG